MKRRGDMLVMTVIACALLAVMLVVGLEVIGVQTAANRSDMDRLALEQLHRSAVGDVLQEIRASGDKINAGDVILEDEPISGQQRHIHVAGINDCVATLVSESHLSDGAKRRYRLQFAMIEKDGRMDFHAYPWFSVNGSINLSREQLLAHRHQDMLLACDRTGKITIGSGTESMTLDGSIYTLHLHNKAFTTLIESPIDVKGNVVATSGLTLKDNLSCKVCAVDGKLTIDEGVTLTAETVYLAQDVDESVLERIDAVIYMPNPPIQEEEEVDSDDDAEENEEIEENEEDELEVVSPVRSHKTIRPLSEANIPSVDGYYYFMIQQLS